MNFFYYRTLANFVNSHAKVLYLALPWSYSTVDRTRLCHKTTAQRGPTPRVANLAVFPLDLADFNPV